MADAKKIIQSGDVGESGPAFLLDHTDPSGAPRPDVWRQAVADFYQLDLDASVLWSQIGPAPLVVDKEQIYMGIGPDSGEVTDILIDPSGASDQVLYITTDDGGIWKTSDGGSNWVPLTDQMFSISMGAVAMDPSNPQVLYGGSGNLFDGGSAFTKGAGIYRSADGGLTWSIVDGGYFGTLFANVGINRIVCPRPDCLLVATNKGLFRSVDGGRNFGANVPDFDDRLPVVLGRICCLFLDSATPASTVYAGVAGNSVDSTGAALPILGLLQSTNSGITFPTNLFSNPGAPAPPYAAFVVAQSQFDGTTANSAVFYASVQTNLPDHTGSYVGFFRSRDSGQTWTLLNSLKAVAAGDGFSQTNYDLTVGVDPLNSKRVYAAFQQLWLSIDGGTTFQAKAVTDSKVHWDNHAIVFSPASHRPAGPASPAPVPPTTLYTGTDGGIAASADGGFSWKAINGAIATNLFRGIDIGRGSPANNAYTYGGCQDTGTSGHRPTDLAGQWHASINGDGWLVAVDPSDPTIVYGFDNESFIKTTNAGAKWAADDDTPATFGKNLKNPKPSTERAIALEQTGTVPAARTVYVSEGKVLYKSTDSALIFVATPLAPGGSITCIVTTAAAAATVWAGASDGTVHSSLDGGATWDAAPLLTTPGGAGLPMGPVNHIAVDPANPQRVAVVYGGVSGIHAKFRTRHVFLTLDGGATWYDVSGTDGNGPVGNLPDLPLRSVVFDKSANPSALIVAGDSGVLRSKDATVTGTGVSATGSATWKIYGAGLPMVCCNSLAIDNAVTPPLLRVGTYGRSCFEATRPTGPVFAADANLAFGVVATGQSVTLPFYVYNSGDAPLQITAASVLGLAPFSFGATPTLPVSIAPGGTQAFQVTFAPTAPGDALVLLEITSNDGAQATRHIPASGTGVNTGLRPRLAANPIASVGFGTVMGGASRTIPVQLFNVGTAPLSISAITLSSGSNDFSLDPAPAFPIAIPAGGEFDLTLKFAPSGAGSLKAVFSLASNDPHSPFTLTARGTGDLTSAAFWAQILMMFGLAQPVTP